MLSTASSRNRKLLEVAISVQWSTLKSTIVGQRDQDIIVLERPSWPCRGSRGLLRVGLVRAAAHGRQSRSSRYRPIIVSRAASGSLRIVDQRISNHLDRSASCCANPAHNRAIKDIHYLNGLYNIRDRSTRSLLERSCAALIPRLQFIVPAPAQVRTPQLKLQSALGVRNNRHKVRRNSFWFTHRPQECAATSLVRIRHPSLRSAIS